MTHPGGTKFAGEKRGGVRGKEEGDSLTRGEGEETEEGVQRDEMSDEARLKGEVGGCLIRGRRHEEGKKQCKEIQGTETQGYKTRVRVVKLVE